ncbi:hypothetical protein CTAYLR_004438 [Chrysophaeum taylorii]|uniref:Uncharacterized protein n=1 Tax=Chrysophaeum taylorii TaxID=2483200 RepID=A0AAD7UBV4_9STRA|nr:hypothetical protein CTAYLR_004438 [Chrysophaeum taylorii]
MYAGFLASVAHKSRLAAAALPHAVFCAFVALSWRVAPRLSRVAYGSPHLTAALLIVRLVHADAACRLLERGPVAQPRAARADAIVASDVALALEARHRATEELKVWVALAAERCCRGLWFVVPYGDATAARWGLDATLAEARGVYLVWLQFLPSARACAYAAAANAAKAALPSLVGAPRPARTTRQNGGILDRAREASGKVARLLAMPWLFGDRVQRLAAFLADIVSDADAWLLLAVGACAFCTVGPVARLGALAVVFALPGLNAIKAIQARAPTPVLISYWIVLALLDLILLNPGANTIFSWLPFKSHVAILLAEWLQLPYFRGAHRLYVSARLRVRAAIDRFKEA